MRVTPLLTVWGHYDYLNIFHLVALKNRFDLNRDQF